MPVHNGLPYLGEALESVLNQSLRDFEFLIIDDASTDGTTAVLAEYARRDHRIRILANEQNMGLGYSLERGVAEASTPWIARMDADDISSPGRLESQVKFLNENPEVDIVGAYALRINERGDVLGEKRVPVSHEQIRRLIWTCPFNHNTVIMRREGILAAGSYSPRLRINEDYDLWFRCASCELRFANMPIPLVSYRVTRESYRRKSLARTVRKTLIGWRGCRMVRASPRAYVGVTAPIFVGLMPASLRSTMYHWLVGLFDPRERSGA